MRERGEIIRDFLDHVVLLCTVAADPGANEGADVCAKGDVFVGSCDHGLAEEGGEGGACLAHAGGGVGRTRIGVGRCPRRVGRADMCRERDAEGGKRGGCGRALDKLWGRGGTRAGRGGTLGWAWRGRVGEIGKGEGGCASWDVRGDCPCPLADKVCARLRDGEGLDAEGGGLGIGETLGGAVRAGSRGEAILRGGERGRGAGRETYEFAFAGETPVDVHGEEDAAGGYVLEKKLDEACSSLSSYISDCHFEPNPDPTRDRCHPNQADPYSRFPSQFNYLIYTSFSLSSIEHNSRHIVSYLFIYFLAEIRSCHWETATGAIVAGPERRSTNTRPFECLCELARWGPPNSQPCQ